MLDLKWLCVIFFVQIPSLRAAPLRFRDIPQPLSQIDFSRRDTPKYPGVSRKSWPAGSRLKTTGRPQSWAGWCGAGTTGRWRHRCHICCGSPRPCEASHRERREIFQKASNGAEGPRAQTLMDRMWKRQPRSSSWVNNVVPLWFQKLWSPARSCGKPSAIK